MFAFRTVVASAMLLAATTLPAQEPSVPKFAGVKYIGGKSCSAATVVGTLSPDSSYLSVLRRPATSEERSLLAVGGGYAVKAEASCVLDLVFDRPLAQARTVAVDFRGGEIKDAQTQVDLHISLGGQSHVFAYRRGLMLDGSGGTELKRFHVLDMPKGSKRLRISISGSARTLELPFTALIDFESLDACFVDDARPEACGSLAAPNPRASEPS